jgi:hypothetical protein
LLARAAERRLANAGQVKEGLLLRSAEASSTLGSGVARSFIKHTSVWLGVGGPTCAGEGGKGCTPRGRTGGRTGGSVTSAASSSDSQKAVAAKFRHSVRQAGVMSDA